MSLESNQPQKALPYEILPIQNMALNCLVLSGFPADRFSIEYISEKQSNISILQRRKRQSSAVSLLAKGKFLNSLIDEVIEVYGK